MRGSSRFVMDNPCMLARCAWTRIRRNSYASAASTPCNVVPYDRGERGSPANQSYGDVDDRMGSILVMLGVLRGMGLAVQRMIGVASANGWRSHVLSFVMDSGDRHIAEIRG